MKKINISQVDTAFVNGSYPIEFLFYYKNKISGKSIRRALRLMEPTFWPLFGRYDRGFIYAEKFQDYNFFTETVVKEKFEPEADNIDLWEKYHRVNAGLVDKLFSISILQFKNGTVIIPKMNHLAGDGYSYFYFLGLLAVLAQRSFIPFRRFVIRTLAAPHHNRTALKYFHFAKSKIEQPIRHSDYQIHFIKVPKDTVKEQIKTIRAEMKESVSTNDILSAMVIKSTFENQSGKLNEKFTLSIPIDVRRQVKKYGSKFFGNGLLFHHFNIDLNRKPEIGRLAVELRRSMPLIDRNTYLCYLETLEAEIGAAEIHTLKPYDPETGCLITNLSRLPSNRLNFGTGNPDFIFPLTIGKNSAAILADQANYILRLVY